MTMAEKIRKTANIFWGITIVACIIMIIAGIILQEENSGYYDNEVLAAQGQELWIVGLCMLPCMWVVTVLIRGFADIVENSAKQTKYLEKLVSRKADLPVASDENVATTTPIPAEEENLNDLLPKL